MIPANQTYQNNNRTYMKPEYFRFLLSNDLIVDGSAGGLLLGPSRDEGGITLISVNADAEVFISPQQIAGWYYLINAFAYEESYPKLGQINRQMGAVSFFAPYAVPEGITAIRVEPKEVGGQLLTPCVYYSTDSIGTFTPPGAKQHLQYLDKINRDAWQKYVLDKQTQGTVRDEAILALLMPKDDN